MVVEKIEDHNVPPRRVVLDLLRVAVAAGRGEIADLQAVPAVGLDPRRPARDLLEHLLDGIGSCQLLYTEYVEDLLLADNDMDDEAADIAGDEADGAHRARVAVRFARLVREQAAAKAARLN